jgi:acyl dehydratase
VPDPFADAPPLSRGMTWEEMTVGLKFRTSWRTITEPDLMTFVNLGGFNEPLFYDARHAAEANFTGRLCPGAFTYMIAEGLTLQTNSLHGTGLAFMSMELTVKKPAYVGDSLCAVVEITGSRPSKGGERGVVSSTITVYNQHHEEVLVYTPVRLIRGKNYVAIGGH